MTVASTDHLGLLRSTLGNRIVHLQSGYLNDISHARATLATLRRADLESPGSDPKLWPLTLGSLPPELQGHGNTPTSIELSFHAALVLYALHQQSRTTEQHKMGIGLGTAVATLARTRGRPGEPDEGTITRFHRLCTAQQRSNRMRELRGLMSLLRAEGIPLDHAQLGVDLHLLERASTRDRVLLKWARDLHHIRPDTTENDDPKSDDTGSSTTAADSTKN